MNKTKGSLITSILMFVTGAFLALGVVFIFPACDAKPDGSFMHCHDAQNITMFIGIGITALSLIGVFTPSKLTAVFSCLSTLAAAAAAILPGTVIKLCMMDTMQCRAVMRPAVIVTCAVFALIAVVNVILDLKNKN
ncbi:MAG: DUF4418 family protein [Ruminococcus sp.]|nr:DUF4418 family protein [Ruminococcus sp.]